MSKKQTFMQSQFAFYFDNDLERPENLWHQLNGNLGKFDQTPIILPIPNEPALVEVPIVQVISKNGSFRLNISRRRLDFFIYGQGRNATFKENKELLEITSNILIENINKFVQTKWIGLVLNFFIEDKSPAGVIADLLNPEFRTLHNGTTTESSIDYIERMNALDIQINNHTQIQVASARFKDENDSLDGLSITRDFNTKPNEESKNNINKEFINKFIQFEVDNLKLDELISLLWKK